MIKGFFFDLDGTLVDTHQANFEAYKRAIFEVSGNEISFEDFKKGIGHVAKTFLPWFAPGLEDADYKRIISLKAEYYKDLMHLTELNAGLIGLIDTVKDDALIVLVTSAKRKNAEAVLTHHSLTKYFDYIIAAEDVERSKPAPHAYELALQKTGLQPHETIAFEDSEAGKQAAEAAGIAVVMIKSFAI